MAVDPAVALGIATVTPKGRDLADWLDYLLSFVPHGTMFVAFMMFWMLGG